MNPSHEPDTLTALAMELQSIAQNGLTYTKSLYDEERFARVRDIAAELMQRKTGFPLEQVKTLFCNETGYQTPKLETRAAIICENRILLVKEQGKWSLPGGWVDYNQSIASNTVKEVWEEAGLTAVPLRLIAVQDRNLHNTPPYAYGICKVFVLCRVTGGSFQPNPETTESRYFSPDALPALDESKNTADQIFMCFAAAADEQWKTLFD